MTELEKSLKALYCEVPLVIAASHEVIVTNAIAEKDAEIKRQRNLLCIALKHIDKYCEQSARGEIADSEIDVFEYEAIKAASKGAPCLIKRAGKEVSC